MGDAIAWPSGLWRLCGPGEDCGAPTWMRGGGGGGSRLPSTSYVIWPGINRGDVASPAPLGLAAVSCWLSSRLRGLRSSAIIERAGWPYSAEPKSASSYPPGAPAFSDPGRLMNGAVLFEEW